MITGSLHSSKTPLKKMLSETFFPSSAREKAVDECVAAESLVNYSMPGSHLIFWFAVLCSSVVSLNCFECWEIHFLCVCLVMKTSYDLSCVITLIKPFSDHFHRVNGNTAEEASPIRINTLLCWKLGSSQSGFTYINVNLCL